MAFLGGVIPTGPGGANPTERSIRKKREELRRGDAAEPARRQDDEAEIHATEESAVSEHVRAVRENDSEESREDHAQRSTYGPGGRMRRPADRHRLDLEG